MTDRDLSRRELLKAAGAVAAALSGLVVNDNVNNFFGTNVAEAAGLEKEDKTDKECTPIVDMKIVDSSNGENYNAATLLESKRLFEVARGQIDEVKSWFDKPYDFSIVRAGNIELTMNDGSKTTFGLVEMVTKNAKTMDGNPAVVNLLEIKDGGMSRFVPVVNIYHGAEGMNIKPEALLFVPDMETVDYKTVSEKLKGVLSINPVNRDVFIQAQSNPNKNLTWVPFYMRRVDGKNRVSEFANPLKPEKSLVLKTSSNSFVEQPPIKGMAIKPVDLKWDNWPNTGDENYCIVPGFEGNTPVLYATQLEKGSDVLSKATYFKNSKSWKWNR